MPSNHDHGVDLEHFCGGTPDDDRPVKTYTFTEEQLLSFLNCYFDGQRGTTYREWLGKILEATARAGGVTIREQKIDDLWGQDERWLRKDWQYDVTSDNTNLGYWDWVAHQEEENRDGLSDQRSS